MKNKIIGLKELREKTEVYISGIQKGQSYIVVRKSRPIFKLSPIDEESENWESAIDFTKIKKGGISIKDLISRL